MRRGCGGVPARSANPRAVCRYCGPKALSPSRRDPQAIPAASVFCPPTSLVRGHWRWPIRNRVELFLVDRIPDADEAVTKWSVLNEVISGRLRKIRGALWILETQGCGEFHLLKKRVQR